ncbi:MAG: hypothetical protein WBF77_00920 [Sulfurimonadaceae bacterium]
MKNIVAETTQHSIWQHGKSASSFAASNQNMTDVRKQVITMALRCDIKDIRTYAGYKGDLLVEITATSIQILKLLQSSAESLGMATVIKENNQMMIHELFCIAPDDVYELKEPN